MVPQPRRRVRGRNFADGRARRQPPQAGAGGTAARGTTRRRQTGGCPSRCSVSRYAAGGDVVKIPARPRTRLAFNITPLIDIVFNIMIFFLVTAHFVRSQEVDPVDLPTAKQTEEEETVPQRIVLTIMNETTLRMNGRDIDRETVEFLIADAAAEGPDDVEVQIRCDKSVPYRVVEPILFDCAGHGIQRVGFKVMEGN
ncbi:MAG: biopolymer transporter ExbD [Planctomycetota bacterium]|nr:MAG: biopolymer transporter ExbD [Planctomycetota bacterium]